MQCGALSLRNILQCGAQRKPNDKVLLHFFSCSPCNRWRKWSPLEQTSNTVENDHLGEIHIKWMDGRYQVMKIKIKSTHPPLLLYDTLVTGMVSSIPPWPLGSSLGPWKVARSWLFRSFVGNYPSMSWTLNRWTRIVPARRNQHTSIHFDTHLVNCPGKTNGIEAGNEDDDGNDMEPVDEACCEAVAVADEVESLRPPSSPPSPLYPPRLLCTAVPALWHVSLCPPAVPLCPVPVSFGPDMSAFNAELSGNTPIWKFPGLRSSRNTLKKFTGRGILHRIVRQQSD